MFTVHQHNNCTIIEISCQNYTAQVVPKYGGILNGLKLHTGEEIIKGYPDEAAIKLNKGAFNNLLFPYPNRIKAGHYEYEGKKYQFPINKPLEGNSIHGFVRHEEFQLLSMQVENESATINLGFLYLGDKDYFPFAFSLEVSYRFKNKSVEINTKIKNEGKSSMPYGLGWHPYFSLSSSIDDCEIQFPCAIKYELDALGIPTGNYALCEEFVNGKQLDGIFLDTCFKWNEQTNEREIWLRHKDKKISVNMLGLFSFFQLYIPPERNCIAIEPMTCPPNALQTGEAVLRLVPQAVHECNYTVAWFGY